MKRGSNSNPSKRSKETHSSSGEVDAPIYRKIKAHPGEFKYRTLRNDKAYSKSMMGQQQPVNSLVVQAWACWKTAVMSILMRLLVDVYPSAAKQSELNISLSKS